MPFNKTSKLSSRSSLVVFLLVVISGCGGGGWLWRNQVTAQSQNGDIDISANENIYHSFATGNNYFVRQLNKNGSEKWRTNLLSEPDKQATRGETVALSDGALVQINISTIGVYGEKCSLSRVNEVGELVWQHTIQAEANSLYNCRMTKNASRIHVLGNSASSLDSYYLTYDLNGNLLNSKIINHGVLTSQEIVSLSDGSVIVLLEPLDEKIVTVKKLDDTDAEVWSNDLTIDSLSFKISIGLDSTVFVYSNKELFELNENGSLAWGLNTIPALENVTADGQHNVYVTSQDADQIVVHKFDKFHQPIYSKSISQTGNNSASDLKVMQDQSRLVLLTSTIKFSLTTTANNEVTPNIVTLDANDGSTLAIFSGRPIYYCPYFSCSGSSYLRQGDKFQKMKIMGESLVIDAQRANSISSEHEFVGMIALPGLAAP